MSTNNLSIVQSPVDSGEKVPVITNWIPMIGFMIYMLVEINYIRKTQDMILRSNTKMLEMMINDFDLARFYLGKDEIHNQYT